jgi:hypothetical protein
LFSLSYGRNDRSRDPETGLGPANISMMEKLNHVPKKMSEQLRHIKEIRDEFNIFMSIARIQRKYQPTMNKCHTDGDLFSDFLLRHQGIGKIRRSDSGNCLPVLHPFTLSRMLTDN